MIFWIDGWIYSTLPFFLASWGGGTGSIQNRAGARVASLEKVLFSNLKICRKKYSLEKQLEINHTAGSILPNAGECSSSKGRASSVRSKW